MGTTATAAPVGTPAVERRSGSASVTRTVVVTFGVLAGLAGVEHGVGEVLQGPVRPEGLVIQSWPDAQAFAILNGEPAFTVIPNLLVTGTLAVVVALIFAIWAARFGGHRLGGPGLLLLSVLLFLVGGGFGPPLIGVMLGVGVMSVRALADREPGRVSRALARIWPWLLAAGVAGYLSLVPGTVVLSHFLGFESASLVAALTALAFAGLVLALIAARAEDARAG